MSDEQDPIARLTADANRQHGAGSIVTLGERGQPWPPGKLIPTGLDGLDDALGVGGYPRGRIVELSGPPSASLTALALYALRSGQRTTRRPVAYVDLVHTFDPTLAAHLGVDLSTLLLTQPDTGEQALEIVELMARSEAVAVIVVDAITALVPREEIAGEYGDAGVRARMISRALRRLCAVVAKTDTLIVFLRPLTMPPPNPLVQAARDESPGSSALKYYASVRIDVRERRGCDQEHAGCAQSTLARIRVIKNKVAPPFQETMATVLPDGGLLT